MPSLPLFHPIPLYIRIKCFSKPLPHSESSDPSSFKFPLPPTSTTGLELRLCSHIRISAKGHVRERPLDYGQVAGLGKPEKKSMVGWGQEVQLDVGQPTWVMEGESKKMGRWVQESTFQAPMTLRCPPSFLQRTVKLEVSLGHLDLRRSKAQSALIVHTRVDGSVSWPRQQFDAVRRTCARDIRYLQRGTGGACQWRDARSSSVSKRIRESMSAY